MPVSREWEARNNSPPVSLALLSRAYETPVSLKIHGKQTEDSDVQFFHVEVANEGCIGAR